MDDLYKIYMESTDEDNEEVDDKKSNIYKVNDYLKRHLQPIIKETLEDRNNLDAIIKFIGEFITKNTNSLSAIGPIKQIPFTDNDTEKIYKIFNTTKDKILEISKAMHAETYPGKYYRTIFINTPPHKLLFTGMLVYGLENENDDVIQCGLFLIGFSQYPIAFHDYWGKYGVKQDVMEYTINHLSNTYIIRKMRNILEHIKYICNSSLNNHRERLLAGHDHAYIKFSNRIRDQFNSSFREIAKAYYANYEKNATQHKQIDEFEDGTKNELEGDFTQITIITDKVHDEFISNGINQTFVNISAKYNEIDKNRLLSYLNKIKNDKNNQVKKFIESIISIYFNHKNYDGSGIPSAQFLDFGLSLYKSISLTQNENSITVKNILLYWVDLIGLRNDFPREATVVYYRKAIFTYFILIIQNYN